MFVLSAMVAGLIFGIGLAISGMVNPAKVLGFLDVTGSWDPSLVCVMAGAMGVAAIAFWFVRRRSRSLLGGPFQLPKSTRINPRLVGGSLLFGAGWGLAGFCPGPALVAASSGAPKAILFLGAMLVGMGLFTLIERKNPSKPA